MSNNFNQNKKSPNNNYYDKTNRPKNKKIQKSFNKLTIDENIKYINPYNFITLPEKCERKKIEERKGKLNGYIECTLKAKTPIIIPDTQNVQETGHKEYRFFNYGEKNTVQNYIIPVIPGSEIRGMLRSDYEVFTDSCMSTLNDDINFISRSKDIKLPGILRKDDNGNWELYKATRYALHTCRNGSDNGVQRTANGNKEAIYLVDNQNRITLDGKPLKTGDEVKFTYKPSNSKFISSTVLELGKGNTEGILFIGELGGKKVKNQIHDSIFVNTNKKIDIIDLKEEVKKLKAIFELYNDKAFNQKIRNNNKVWYVGYDIDNLKELPVWYSKPENKKTYLSLASIGKEAYHRKLSELVKDFMPCIDRSKICNCCNLFGFVANEDSESSKIRISDAIYIKDENPYDKTMTIKELASPHIANATFYALYAPNTEFESMSRNFDFNYDVKIDENGRHEINSDDISIRGRKHYWHHSIENAITTEKNDRNCTITPVKVDTEFKFKVYFNDILKENLDELIAVLSLKYDDKYDLCHKIGKGKPLGFGSCKINVDEVYIKDINIDNGKLKYDIKNYDSYFNNKKLQDVSLKQFKNMDTIPMKEALMIYDFNHIKKYYKNAKVEYPMATKNDKEASMYWFMLNKSTNLRNTYIVTVLPRIIDEVDENNNIKEHILKAGKEELGTTHGIELPRYKN